MAKCLQTIEFTYVQDNGLVKRVVLEGDPLLSDIEITEENRNQVLYQVLEAIYNDPIHAAHKALKTVINSNASVSTNMSYVDTAFVENYNTFAGKKKKPISYELEVAKPISHGEFNDFIELELRKADSNSYPRSILEVQRMLFEQITELSPDIELITAHHDEQFINLETRTFDGQGLEITHYDPDNNQLFLQDDMGTFLPENTKQLINTLLRLRGLSNIDTIIESGDIESLLGADIPYDNIRTWFSVVKSLQTKSTVTVDNLPSKAELDKHTQTKLLEFLRNKEFKTHRDYVTLFLAGDGKRPGKIQREAVYDLDGNRYNYDELFNSEHDQFFGRTDAPKVSEVAESIHNEINRVNEEAGEIILEPISLSDIREMLIKTIKEKGARQNRSVVQVRKDLILDTLLDEEIVRQTPEQTRKTLDEIKNSQRLKALSSRILDGYGLEYEVLDTETIRETYGDKFAEARAFIMDNKVVINGDTGTFAEPIHELSHFILDVLKVRKPAVYNSLINRMQGTPFLEEVRAKYPELDEQLLLEEAFVTMVGISFSGGILSIEKTSWINNNNEFINDVLLNTKRSLSELLGIDSFNFMNLTSNELMNMSFDSILSSFTNSLLNGDFANAELLTDIKNAEDSKGTLTQLSSFRTNMIENGVDADTAMDIWLKSKTENFKSWHNGTLQVDENGEPILYFRGATANEVDLVDTYGRNDLVVVKGEIDNGLAQTNSIKSIFTLDQIVKVKPLEYSVEGFSNNLGSKLIGTQAEVNYTISKLKDIFTNLEFSVSELGGLFYVDYYNKPANHIIELRNKLLRGNKIQNKC